MVDETTRTKIDDGETNGGDTDDEDLEAMANRLEAALDRIARRLAAARSNEPGPTRAALAARLDGLIERVRDALRGPSE